MDLSVGKQVLNLELKMIKKILFALITILFLSGLAAAYFYYKHLNDPISKAVNAIPTNAAIIFESKNMPNTCGKLSETTAFWKDLLNIECITGINKKINFLDSLFAMNNRVSELVTTQSSYISIHLTGAKNFDFLFLIECVVHV